jgi:hypothetical protein
MRAHAAILALRTQEEEISEESESLLREHKAALWRWLRKKGIREDAIEQAIFDGLLAIVQNWQRQVEDLIANVPAAVVLVGPHPTSRQSRECAILLGEFAARRAVIIPVLLPGATSRDVPLFLRNLTWIDLRITRPDPIDDLIQGITGRPPSSVGVSAAHSSNARSSRCPGGVDAEGGADGRAGGPGRPRR